MLAYTPALTPTSAQLAISSTAAWTKFWLLGVNALSLAWVCLTEHKRRPILALLQITPILGAALAFFAPSLLALLSIGLGVGWVSLLVMAARASTARR